MVSGQVDEKRKRVESLDESLADDDASCDVVFDKTWTVDIPRRT